MADEPISTPERAKRPKGITIYESVYETCELLNDQQRHRLLDGILFYGFAGTPPDFTNDKLLAAIWLNVKPNIDAAVARSLDGQRGGRPKGSTKKRTKTESQTVEKKGGFKAPIKSESSTLLNSNQLYSESNSKSISTHSQRESDVYYNDTDLADEDYVF